MTVKWMGAGMILLGSGAFGCCLARNCRREEAMLRSLLHALGWMERELRYHVTPLPELCRQAAQQTSGPLRRVFQTLSQALLQQMAADASGCMAVALGQTPEIPGRIRNLLCLLGAGLGCFDLGGQLEGLQEVQAACKETLDTIRNGREERLRSYQTLSFCAGAALVILFI